MGRFFAGMTDVRYDTTLPHVLFVQSTCRSSHTRESRALHLCQHRCGDLLQQCFVTYVVIFLLQEKGVHRTPGLAIRNKVVSKNFYIAEEGNDMNRYEFILVDGSRIAVYADSRTEAAKKVREMLNA